ncbi:MAG TPA: adenosylcobinamide amidohydrolase [Kofleriaceae bacterium]|nr:adenosylcobinamide amidohydrolase [Kofleriaceae bacterium]
MTAAGSAAVRVTAAAASAVTDAAQGELARAGAPVDPAGPTGPTGIDVSLRPRWLIARFLVEHTTASWAIVGGGLGRARAVAWHQVRDAELPPDVDPVALLRARLAAIGSAGAIGLLTTRRLDRHVDVTVRSGSVAARCIATVGLGNALRAGDPPGPGRPGTINLLCRLDAPLSPEAQLEALALAAEARALAVREADIPSTRTGRPASGTGTDCIVIAAPAPDLGSGAAAYAGKHTAIGHAIGAAVHEATRRGALDWRREHARRSAEEGAR